MCNVYLITLSFHDADLNNVIQAFAKRFIRLENECKLLISEKEKTVWASILAYMRNMKSQQAIVNFLELRVNYSCRMCYADELIKDDMIFDTVNYDHYHHQTLHTRFQDITITEKIKREKFFQAHELTLELSALQAMTLALDLILSWSDDSTHSKFADIVQRVMSILCHDILTSSTLKIFTECFWSFSFSFDWDCIQSSAKHLRSWTMSECVRVSVIVSILLRCWSLKNSHIRFAYCTKLLTQCDSEFKAVKWIIYYFAQMIKSNSLIASTSLSVQDCIKLNDIILEVRKEFQIIMHAVKSIKKKSSKISKTKKLLKEESQACQVSIIFIDSQISDIESQVSSITTNIHLDSTSTLQIMKNKITVLLNVHSVTHFQILTQEYDLLWNVNSLSEEQMYKWDFQLSLNKMLSIQAKHLQIL